MKFLEIKFIRMSKRKLTLPLTLKTPNTYFINTIFLVDVKTVPSIPFALIM